MQIWSKGDQKHPGLCEEKHYQQVKEGQGIPLSSEFVMPSMK